MTPEANVFKNSSALPRWSALVIAVAITCLGGALYGSYIQRWNPPQQLLAATAQLSEMPREIGNWSAAEDIPFDKETLQILDCTGSVNRRYVNRQTGQAIQCSIIVGRPGPIAVHTPEVCFSSRDYEIENNRVEVAIGDPKHQHSFWKSDFSSRNPLSDGLRVYYAWSTGDSWKASKSPRVEFGGEPLLYKIQLTSVASPNAARVAQDSGQQFMEDFVASTWPFEITEKR